MLELTPLVLMGLSCFGLAHILHYNDIPLWKDLRGWLRAKLPLLNQHEPLALITCAAVYFGHTYLTNGQLVLDPAHLTDASMNILALTGLTIVGESIR